MPNLRQGFDRLRRSQQAAGRAKDAALRALLASGMSHDAARAQLLADLAPAPKPKRVRPLTKARLRQILTGRRHPHF